MKPVRQLTTPKLPWVLKSPQSLTLPNTFVAQIKWLFIAHRSSHHIAATLLHHRSTLSKRNDILHASFPLSPLQSASCYQSRLHSKVDGARRIVCGDNSAISCQLKTDGCCNKNPLLPCRCSSCLPSFQLSRGLSTPWHAGSVTHAESLIRTAWPSTRSGCSEMGCWIIETDAFDESQLFYLLHWHPSCGAWILQDRVLLQKAERISKHRWYAPRCRFKLPTPTTQTWERLMVTELQLWVRVSLLMVAHHHPQKSAPNGGRPRAEILIGFSSLWCCTFRCWPHILPQLLHQGVLQRRVVMRDAGCALHGSWKLYEEPPSFIIWQAGRFPALWKRPLPSEFCSTRDHLRSLLMSCYSSLSIFAHFHKVQRAIS